MAKGLRILLVLLFLSQVAAQCPGTETGNPKVESPTSSGEPTSDSAGESAETYTNEDHLVTTQYDEGWSFEEEEPSPANQASAPACATCSTASPSSTSEGIDISDAASTEFTDGTSLITIYYVNLDTSPPSLFGYLTSLFKRRSPFDFRTFSNRHMTGLLYDNSEKGERGGDRREYYFLNDTLLLYVVTDILEENDGLSKAETILDSLQFE